jgi:hypothetical protein
VKTYCAMRESLKGSAVNVIEDELGRPFRANERAQRYSARQA